MVVTDEDLSLVFDIVMVSVWFGSKRLASFAAHAQSRKSDAQLTNTFNTRLFSFWNANQSDANLSYHQSFGPMIMLIRIWPWRDNTT